MLSDPSSLIATGQHSTSNPNPSLLELEEYGKVEWYQKSISLALASWKNIPVSVSTFSIRLVNTGCQSWAMLVETNLENPLQGTGLPFPKETSGHERKALLLLLRVTFFGDIVFFYWFTDLRFSSPKRHLENFLFPVNTVPSQDKLGSVRWSLISNALSEAPRE